MASNVTIDTVGSTTQAQEAQNGQLYLYLSVLLLSVGFVAFRTWRAKVHDEKEPYVLPSRYPILGHFYGMMKHQAEYLKILA